MIENLKKHYVGERLQRVDQDFLEFEETQAPTKDLELISSLLQHPGRDQIKLPNPHNSIILYLVGLTDEFDSFKGRADTVGGSPPDIDIDFDALDRDKAVEWVVNHWGRENVANIITHGSFKPKSIFRKYYGVTEGSPTDLAYILSKIPAPKFGKEPSLDMFAEAVPTIPSTYPEVWGHAKKLENMVSHFGIHAAGVVISDKPIMETVPVWSNSKCERITQFDKDEIEELGMIKFDFLGIDNLSVLKEACKLIEQRHGTKIDIDNIPDGDPQAYEALTKGMFAGVFQMEGPGASVARKMFQAINPSSIEMISDVSALNRPGPQQAKLDQEYVRNRQAGVVPNGLPGVVAKVLEKTFYTLVYQEQVMELCAVLAGFNLKEADDVRRAMGKKDGKKLAKHRAEFLQGCAKVNVVTQQYAASLWEMLAGDPDDPTKNGFADYCFNKSHSVAYAYLAYVTAWVKTHYPHEFFCALMSVRSVSMSPKDWRVKASDYVSEAKQLGVEITPPSINHSGIGFLISGDEVLFGLGGVRDVGATASKAIIQARAKKPFSDVMDFLHRVNLQKVNSKVFCALVRAGAFDRLGYQRAQLLEQADALYGFVRGLVAYEEKKTQVAQREQEILVLHPILDQRDEVKKLAKKKGAVLSEEQIALLEETEGLRRLVPLKLGEAPVAPMLTRSSRISMALVEVMEQADHIGCYLGQHPAQFITTKTSKLGEADEGDFSIFGGVVVDCKEITTRTKQKMAFVTLDDSTAVAEVVLFATVWNRVKNLGPGDLITLTGEIESLEPLKLKARTVDIYRSNT